MRSVSRSSTAPGHAARRHSLQLETQASDLSPKQTPYRGVERMKLSIVIPYYRAATTVATQLEALTRQKWSESWEVVISDNEGSDELTKIARVFGKRLSSLRLVDSSDGRGAGHARNAGVEAAKGELIAFCDADDEVGSGWLSAIGSALAEHEFVACRADIKKLNPEWVQRVFADDLQQWQLDRLTFPPYLPYAGGSSIGVRRSVHESVGGFDESWPVHQDTDYCLRIQLSGAKLRFLPEALIHYRLRTTIPGLFNRARIWAKYYVRLYERYRSPGTQMPNAWKWQITQLDHLLRSRLDARSPSLSTRAAWFVHLGWDIGLLQGSVRYLTSPPPPFAPSD